MIYHELLPYLEAKENYINTPFRIIDGVGYCFVKGEWISQFDFDKFNTKPSFEIAAKQNPDGTVIHSGIIPPKSRR